MGEILNELNLLPFYFRVFHKFHLIRQVQQNKFKKLETRPGIEPRLLA